MRPNEDLYVNFGGMSDDNQRAVIQSRDACNLGLGGGLVLIGGTLICLVLVRSNAIPRTRW